jgi:hypothetical protein
MAQIWRHVQRGVPARPEALTARSARPGGIRSASRASCVRARSFQRRSVLLRRVVPGEDATHSEGAHTRNHRTATRGLGQWELFTQRGRTRAASARAAKQCTSHTRARLGRERDAGRSTHHARGLGLLGISSPREARTRPMSSHPEISHPLRRARGGTVTPRARCVPGKTLAHNEERWRARAPAWSSVSRA